MIKTNTHTSSVISALHEITALEKLCAVLELVERIVLGHSTVSRKCECLNLDIFNLVAANLMDLECRAYDFLQGPKTVM